MTLSSRSFLVGVGILVLTGCAGSSDPPPVYPREVGGSMRVEQGRFLLEVDFPDDVRALMLFDTGTGDYDVIDQELSRQLGLEHRPVDPEENPFFGVRTTLPWFEAAGVGQRQWDVFVEDFRVIDHLNPLPVAGVLGPAGFRGVCVRFSPSRGLFSTDAPRQLAEGQSRIELTWGPGGTLWTTAWIAGRPLRAMVDTGAERSALDGAVAKSMSLETTPQDDGRTEAEPVNLRLALHTVADVVLDVRSGMTELDGPEFVLGMDVLGRTDVLFDFAESPCMVLGNAEER